MCYYFDDIIKLEDFDIDDILIDEKSQANILIYDFHIKLLLVQNLFVLDLTKWMDLLEFIMELDINIVGI